MTSRQASCRCGALTAIVAGDPVRVSVCHCRDCQKRTGGPFSAQARFRVEDVTIEGAFRTWHRIAESGRSAEYRWCAVCGGTIAYVNEGAGAVVAIPIGAFAPGDLPIPQVSVFDERAQPWLTIADTIRRE